MKNLLKYLALGLAVLIIAACSNDNAEEEKGSSSSDGAEYTLNYVHVVQENHPTHMVAEEFKKKVEELSDGRIEVEIFCCGQLYTSETEAAEAVIKGDVDMMMSAAPSMSSINSKFMVFDLPFLFNNKEEGHAALDGELGKLLDEELEKMGVVSLGWGATGFKQLVSAKDPIRSIDDLKGMKMRVMENKVHLDVFNSLGANASPLAFGEVYSALSQGTFDMLDSTASYVMSQSFYEVVDYFTVTNHFFHPAVTFINKDVYDSMPEDLQQVLHEASDTISTLHRELIFELEEEDHQRMIEEGVEVIELSDEELAKFREAVQPIYEKYADEIGQDLIDAAQSYVQ